MTHHPNPGRKSKTSDAPPGFPSVLRLSLSVEKKRKAFDLAKKRKIGLSRLVEMLLDEYPFSLRK